MPRFPEFGASLLQLVAYAGKFLRVAGGVLRDGMLRKSVDHTGAKQDANSSEKGLHASNQFERENVLRLIVRSEK